MTSTLRDLRAELQDVRATRGGGSSQAQAAFENLVRAADQAGAPLDGLRRHTADETERFFAFTISGVDGHVYWDGPKEFRRNDGGYNRPYRWWWAHVHGGLDKSIDLIRTCREKNCINPEHHVTGRTRGTAISWTEQRIIGAVQVAAMRLGHTPAVDEWDQLGLRPNRGTIQTRFGGWNKAMLAAGLTPNPHNARAVSRAQCLDAVRFVRDRVGHLPSDVEFLALGAELKAHGLPTAIHTVAKHCGSWVRAKLIVGEKSE